ncbi:hypothetical protein BUALT_Bualt03G0148700 [Buddleja alternifolia]|uniref:Uncharacterized protein n=1 Tax=Buddleja alternifolia TaxID=168488 RepID=A0AAV6Y1X6_9LAMI|nr:hypothetical protein BUALT_Bualt03G0147200 [Buddleja alternifolia]KAG8386437.1 hypothetical protein BUALT_Bualt03G0148700 [Buddleja alternifolia]
MYLHESTPIPSSVNCLNCSHTIDLPPISAAAESFLCPHCLTRIFYYRTARLSSLPPITTPAAPDLGDYGNHYWPPITTPALGSFIDTLPMRLVMLLPADSKTESCSICIEDFFEKERRNSSCSADIFVTMTKELPLIAKVNDWLGSNVVIPTCHETDLNFRLAISLRMGWQSTFCSFFLSGILHPKLGCVAGGDPSIVELPTEPKWSCLAEISDGTAEISDGTAEYADGILLQKHNFSEFGNSFLLRYPSVHFTNRGNTQDVIRKLNGAVIGKQTWNEAHNERRGYNGCEYNAAGAAYGASSNGHRNHQQ